MTPGKEEFRVKTYGEKKFGPGGGEQCQGKRARSSNNNFWGEREIKGTQKKASKATFKLGQKSAGGAGLSYTETANATTAVSAQDWSSKRSKGTNVGGVEEATFRGRKEDALKTGRDAVVHTGTKNQRKETNGECNVRSL